MWYYALVLCFQWSGRDCSDLRVVDQDPTFTTLKECREHGLAHQTELLLRPGWERIIRGTLCAPRPPSQVGLDDPVYSTSVIDVKY